jgi:glucokinase
LEALNSGLTPLYFKEGTRAEEVSAKTIADAARAGDETALKVFGICAEYLGRGLSVIIDILNPQVIVIGSIFARCQDLLYPIAEKIIKQEALLDSASCCKIVPAELGEQIGDYGAIAAALLED